MLACDCGISWSYSLTIFGSFVIFQGIWTSIAKKPYILVFSQGGGGGCPAWSLCAQFVLQSILLALIQYAFCPKVKNYPSIALERHLKMLQNNRALSQSYVSCINYLLCVRKRHIRNLKRL